MRRLRGCFWIVSVLLGCVACSHEKGRQTEKMLIGDWKFVVPKPTGLTPPPYQNNPSGYTFYDNGIVDTKLPYFSSDSEYGSEQHCQFLGTKTTYMVRGDSLSIYNPVNCSWNTRKIISCNADSMVLKTDSLRYLYKKQHYNLDTMPTFDQIILSSSGCYGSCPIANIIIDSDGSVVFDGLMYTTLTGCYTSTITKEQYNDIQNKFRKANIKNIATDYFVEHTDDETISTTFVKDGKIFKSIRDYGRAGPDELVWAYVPLRELYQTIPLKKLGGTNFPTYLQTNYTRFEKGDLVIPFSRSESFLLWNYLRKGTKTTLKFKPRYSVGFFDVPLNGKESSKIETDGRYYRFSIHGSSPITIDLGFNFFDNNFKESDFKEKQSY